MGRIKSDTPLSRIATPCAHLSKKNSGFHCCLFVAYPLPSDFTAMNRKLSWLFTAILLALAHPAEPQQSKNAPRIGFLSAVSPSTISARVEAFRQGLRELGYVEGKNIFIEWRFAEEKFDRLPSLAAELVRLK